MQRTDLSNALKLKYPLVVAPMAGGPTTPKLVSESSKAGALGFVGGAYLHASAIQEFVKQVRAETDRPFGINLFVPSPETTVTDAQLKEATEKTAKYRKELGLSNPTLSPPYEEDFSKQFETVLSLRPSVFSFIFGTLSSDFVQAAKKEKIFVMGTATTLEEALELEANGVDGITLQGIEAGGHRAIFDRESSDAEISALELLRACFAKTKLPLVIAGGIMNSKQIQNALKEGAQAVQMGTAFLACKEAGTSEPYRKKLLESNERKTKTTRAFSGRLARGIENRFMLEMERVPDAILPFPAQNKFTRDLRTASSSKGLPDFLSLWSGTGAGKLWTGTTAELISNLFPD